MNNVSLTVCICTFNRCKRLNRLINELRKQESPIPFDILVINNNSTDQTEQTLRTLITEPGPVLRYVNEYNQGITYARNRAISECIDKRFILFIDDDELPEQHLITAAVSALINEQADCVGGKVHVFFGEQARPFWLSNSLMGFLAETDYGDNGFWITDNLTPIWTANVAYNMRIFRDNPDLRFDLRYNRKGEGIGGGEDLIMFKELLLRNCKIRYQPDMVVSHHIDSWKLKRSYFIKLHFLSGIKKGQNELIQYKNKLFGIPLFLFTQLLQQSYRWLVLILKNDSETVRQGMNAAFTLGIIWGCFLKSYIQTK